MTSDEITIRSATLEDLPALLEFEQGIISAERPHDSTLKPDPLSYYDLRELIADPEAEIIVAESNGTLVGSGSARRKRSRHYTTPDFHAYLGFMYVAPSHRGKGINSLILDALSKWAVANGLPELKLTVYPDNEAAVRAYEKAGFEPYILEMRMRVKE